MKNIFVLFFILRALPLYAEVESPHILYINIDDLGIMDVGYNHSVFHTPNIDRLAKEGMVFTDAYAPAANCAPSRAAVHSGQWSTRHGVYTVGNSDRGHTKTRKLVPIANRRTLPDTTFTMASALKSAGYKTIHLGKYHIGPDPLTQGFDINIGGNEAGGPRHGGYFSPWKGGAMEKFSAQYPKGTHRMDVFADQCIRFMKAHLDRPMFIHLSPYSVHGRLEAIPGLVEKYDKAKVHPIYASMVEKMDQCIGDVLKAIDELGIKNNTLVVFSSDNGGICAIQSQSPYRAGKGSYYEGGIRKPMVVRWPNKIKAGSRCHTPVSSLDFYPTFLDIAQSTVPKNKILDGLSLMPLFTQSGSWPNRALYWHFPIYLQAYQKGRDGGRDPLFRTRPGSALRYGKWKLHEYFEDGVLELYNLESDLGEQVDLSTSLPEKTTELKTMLDQWREKTRGAVPTQLNPNFDPHFKD